MWKANVNQHVNGSKIIIKIKRLLDTSEGWFFYIACKKAWWGTAVYTSFLHAKPWMHLSAEWIRISVLGHLYNTPQVQMRHKTLGKPDMKLARNINYLFLSWTLVQFICMHTTFILSLSVQWIVVNTKMLFLT